METARNSSGVRLDGRMRNLGCEGWREAYPRSRPMTSLFHPTPPFAPAASLTDLDARARDIFRRVVESYLDTGDPVGSRTISKSGLLLSPASIRNTMQDLTHLGLLDAPHISA